ncbi:MAG: GerMN domain-containing protein [bacterium]|nr:GerMN domain-containing protein [bacterium]
MTGTGKKLAAAALVLMLVLAGGCGGRDAEIDENTVEYGVYFLNSEETKVLAVETNVSHSDIKTELSALIETMQRKPEDVSMHAPLDYAFGVNSVTLNGEQVIVNFDEHYLELKSTTAVLIRAAIVRTLTQVEGVTCVSFQINGQPLTDSFGNPLGILTADMFVDNAGTEINAYETTTLTLYYTNEAGDMLLSEKREIEYNSNIALERIVVDQVLAGPQKRDAYPTVNPETGIISVSIKDGICYVNLDQDFLTQVYNVTSEVTIYSIVNSLVELGGINQVQILVEGKSDLMYREKISLNTLFERNLELIEK